VAPGVTADLTGLFLGPVPAVDAEPHALLRLLERRGELQRLVARRAQQVEREAVRCARPDAGQPRQLRDEVVDRRAEHAAIVPVCIGPDALASAGSGER